MAYSIAWNEAAPIGGSTSASTIDTELQNLKISVRERLEDAFPTWSTDGTDPKTLAILALEFDRVQVKEASSFEIPHNSATEIDFSAVVYESNASLWDVGTPTDIVIQTSGLYLISAMVSFEANATGYRRILLYKESAAITGPPIDDTEHSVLGGVVAQLAITTELELIATDTISLAAFQNSTAALDVTANLMVRLVAPTV